ncbi:MAG: sugar transferase [Kiritimatiellaeota bacterium]|nr:sugar transferase [Kiritimatiellota bacterium]
MIPDLAKRAAKTPRNDASRLFKRIMLIELLGGALVILIAYGCALWYVYDAVSPDVVSPRYVYHKVPFFRKYIDNFPRYGYLFFLFHTTINWLIGKFSQRKKFETFHVLFASFINGAVMMIGVWFFVWYMKAYWHMRGFFTMFVMAQVPASLFVSIATEAIFRRLFKTGYWRKTRALLIGAGPAADEACEKSERGGLGVYEITRRVAPPPDGADMRAFLAPLLAETPGIDAVFVFDAALGRDAVMELIVESALAGKYAKATLPMHENAIFARQDWLCGERVAHFNCPRDAHEHDIIRGAGAHLMAPFALILLLPLHLVLSALIRRDSPGAAVFRQRRFGLLGAEFTMFKYRTMFDDAEEKRGELAHLNENDGGLFKIKSDPRVTNIGCRLRKSSLDELPQVFNILRGEMMPVGPRPLPCRDLDGYGDRWQSARFFAKPGITGVWQTAGRAHVKFDEMCELDIWYSLNRTFRLDLIVLWKTVKSVIFGIGAY